MANAHLTTRVPFAPLALGTFKRPCFQMMMMMMMMIVIITGDVQLETVTQIVQHNTTILC